MNFLDGARESAALIALEPIHSLRKAPEDNFPENKLG